MVAGGSAVVVALQAVRLAFALHLNPGICPGSGFNGSPSSIRRSLTRSFPAARIPSISICILDSREEPTEVFRTSGRIGAASSLLHVSCDYDKML